MFKTDHRLRDALADYFAEQYPVGRRALVAKRFKLTNDEARAVCDGSASPTTLDKVWRKGGWGLVIPVFARLLGEDVSQHFAREAARHDEIARDYRSFARVGARDGSAATDGRHVGVGSERRQMGGRSASAAQGGE